MKCLGVERVLFQVVGREGGSRWVLCKQKYCLHTMITPINACLVLRVVRPNTFNYKLTITIANMRRTSPQ